MINDNNNSNKILRHCCRHIKTNLIFQGHMMMKAGHMLWFNTDLNLFIYIDERKLLLLHISQHDLQDCCCRWNVCFPASSLVQVSPLLDSTESLSSLVTMCSFTPEIWNTQSYLLQSSGEMDETFRSVLVWKVPSWLGRTSPRSTSSWSSSPSFLQNITTLSGKKPVAWQLTGEEGDFWRREILGSSGEEKERWVGFYGLL